jgi:hypothetical protein
VASSNPNSRTRATVVPTPTTDIRMVNPTCGSALERKLAKNSGPLLKPMAKRKRRKRALFIAPGTGMPS